jgi:hypothetical protein
MRKIMHVPDHIKQPGLQASVGVPVYRIVHGKMQFFLNAAHVRMPGTTSS